MKALLIVARIAIGFVLFCASLSIVPNSALAEDTSGPEISDVHIEPKYPQHLDQISVFATVVDMDSTVSNVELYYCIETCLQRPMYDPDGDDIYNQTLGLYAAGTVIDYWVAAWDSASNSNESSKVWFSVVSNITVGFELSQENVFLGEVLWANGTALYDGNESTPVETSTVTLRLEGTALQTTESTDSEGILSISFQAPDAQGIYRVNISVSNKTLSGYALTNLTVSEPGDTDGDGLDDNYENLIGTDPEDPDSDGDELNDYEEVFDGDDGYITDPLDTDTDDDGLTDWEEVNEGEDGFLTDPTNKDTDGDGVSDSEDWRPIDPAVQHQPEDYTLPLVIALVVVIAVVATVIALLLAMLFRKRKER